MRCLVGVVWGRGGAGRERETGKWRGVVRL